MRNFVLAMAVTASLSGIAQSYDNPDFECRTTAMIIPTKVERTPDATKITFHSTYRPKWWISIDSTACITDPISGNRYAPVATEGITLGEHFYMPESGEADFTVIYPALPDEVKAIDFNDGSWNIYGLRLDGGKAPHTARIDLDKWEAEHRRPYPGVPAQFFNPGEASVSGVIDGYSPKLGFTNFLIYYNNPVTGESIPTAVDIAPDGTFSAKIPMVAPGYVSLSGMIDQWQSHYAEPGRSLEIALDIDDILQNSFIKRAYRIYENPPARFGGDLGEINTILAAAPKPQETSTQKMAHDVIPSEAMKQLKETYEANCDTLEKYIASHPDLNPHAIRILRKNVRANTLSDMLDYFMHRGWTAASDSLAPTLKEPLTVDHYACIRELLTDSDQWMLANRYMVIIPNRLAFFDTRTNLVIPEEKYLYSPVDPGFEYLKSLGAAVTPEEEELAAWVNANINSTDTISVEKYRNIFKTVYDIAERNGMTEQYMKHLNGVKPSQKNRIVYNTVNRAEAMKKFAGTEEVPLLWQSGLASSLGSYGTIQRDDYTQDEINSMLHDIEAAGAISNPDIASLLNAFYNTDSSAFELPDDERGRIISEIIAPYKGKMVLIDFWSTGCGPCRAEIERTAELRARNLDNPDFKMIFITGESDSPKSSYEKYAGKNLAGEASYRLSDTDYNRLRDLFRFNGIPRHILIDRDGKVIDTQFHYHDLSDAMEPYGVTLR